MISQEWKSKQISNNIRKCMSSFTSRFKSALSTTN